jgi:accessory gene regulator protein AgrB
VNMEILCKTAILMIMTVTTHALVVPERSMIKSVFNSTFLNIIQVFPVTVKFLRKSLAAPCVLMMVT